MDLKFAMHIAKTKDNRAQRYNLLVKSDIKEETVIQGFVAVKYNHN